MTAEKIVTLTVAVLLASPLSAPRADDNADPIARLTELVDLRDGGCDALPLYEAVAAKLADGTYSRADLRSGKRIPEYESAADCSGYSRDRFSVFAIEHGEMVAGEPLPNLLSTLNWVRGLEARLEARHGDSAAAWLELRRALIVSLHHYRGPGAMIERLLGIATLRLAAQSALRADIPETNRHRQLFEEVVLTCQRERLQAEELVARLETRRIYAEMPESDEDKVVYDLIRTLSFAAAHQNDPIGANHFLSAVSVVVRSDCERCWQLLFRSLERFSGTRHRTIQDFLAFCADRDQAEAKRMMRRSPVFGAPQ